MDINSLELTIDHDDDLLLTTMTSEGRCCNFYASIKGLMILSIQKLIMIITCQ